jgi:tetratricopeptide (TPR) repeat protein
MSVGTNPIDRGARTRALTMLAYTRDVAGDHGAASAWYRQALEVALPHKRPGLLLDLGTSLSKQGRYDESLVSFDNAIAALPDAGEPRATRLHAQVLSRRAALLELMGNPTQAVALQREAIALACSVNDRDGELSASLRLVRHLVALRQFDEALAILDELGELERTERNGRLYVAHDRARLLRARGAWSDARAAYAVAIEQLPATAGDIVRGNLDVWLEITSGLADVSSKLGDRTLEELARRAHGAAAELAAARGLYRGEPVERSRLAERAAEAIDALRSAPGAHASDLITTADFLIDFGANRITRRTTSQSLPLRPSDVATLRLLAGLPRDGRAQRQDLVRALSKANAAKGSAERFKDVIHEMRVRLGLGDSELVVGRADRRGGYALAWEAHGEAGSPIATRQTARRAPRSRE